MAHVVFYEKPGCAGNERQKALLRRAGHEVEVRDLLTHPWTRDELLGFLGDVSVSEWIDRTAPRVRSGEVDPASLTPGEALSLLLSDPSLIRRPLLEVGTRREVGFLAAAIDQWIGLAPVEPAADDGGVDGGSGAASPSGGDLRSPPRLVSISLGPRRKA